MILFGGPNPAWVLLLNEGWFKNFKTNCTLASAAASLLVFNVLADNPEIEYNKVQSSLSESLDDSMYLVLWLLVETGVCLQLDSCFGQFSLRTVTA